MNATIKEIAKKSGYSIATVSRALRDDPKVKDETIKIVKEVAKSLNYNPNILARIFVKKTSNIIGLALPEITSESFSEIIRGVDEYFIERNYFTLVSSSHQHINTLQSVSNLVSTGLLGGIIILVPYLPKELKKILVDNNIPFVIIAGDTNIGDYDIVSVDNFYAAYSITEYLIKKGYKRIAHLAGPPENSDAKTRIEGYKAALENHKIPYKDELIFYGDFKLKSGIKGFEHFMKLKKPPEAIFCCNDLMALGCYEKAAEMKVKIPKDISIVGIDNALFSRFLSPPLTTVEISAHELGAKAAEILYLKITKQISTPQKVKIVPKIITRGSA